MRKIFIVILASIIAVSGVYAGTSSSGSTNDSSGWTGGSPSVNLKFAIDGDTTALYNIGFSDAPGIPEDGRTSGDITLDFNADDPTKIDNSGEASKLYIYWDIVSAQPFTLSLSADRPLTNDSAVENNTIDFTVSGDTSQEGETANTEAGTAVNINTSTSAMNTPILFQADESGLNTFRGYQKLTIESVAGELDGKVEGDYTANLTLTVTSGS